MSTPPTLDEQIADLADQLLDLAVSTYHDRASDDVLTECHMCGEWEGHRDGCPVPALKRWMDTPPAVAPFADIPESPARNRALDRWRKGA